MLIALHRIAALAAALTIVTFWLSTIIAEAFLPVEAVIRVKTLIPWGFVILIPALALAGATGVKLARGRTAGVLGQKRRRMPIMAANGIVVLIPSALFLAARAQAGTFDDAFYMVQSLELVAGAVNLTLIGLNIRDGRRLTAGRRRRSA